MAAFSRLQLAAALLEYDNDPDNPNAPQRSAQESAIFAHMRRAQARPKQPAARRSTDYLGVALPSDGGDGRSVAETSNLAYRQSTASFNALVNPFGPEEEHEEVEDEDEAPEQTEENLEVDLASWGLDAFIPKEKRKGGGKRNRTKSGGPSELLPVRREMSPATPTAAPRMRSMSMGNFDNFGLGGAFLDADSTDARPKSVGYPLDFVGEQQPHPNRRASQHALIDRISTASPLHSSRGPSRGRTPEPRPASSIAPARSMSMGNFDNFGLGGAFLDAVPSQTSLDGKSRPVGTPQDYAPTKRPAHPRRTPSSHDIIDQIATANPALSVPFPRAPSPGPDAAYSRPPSRGSNLDMGQTRRKQTISQASFGTAPLFDGREREQVADSIGASMLLGDDDDEEEGKNPFALRPPSPDRASRFDPKARARTTSATSRDLLTDENNPFHVPFAENRTSKFDPKGAAHARTISNASFGSRMLLDDGASHMSTATRPYSKWDLMRPKVLIMPSPLQDTQARVAAPPPPTTRDGWHLSYDNASQPSIVPSKSQIVAALTGGQPTSSLAVPNPGSSFTPNPRSTMTLSQLTFRNTLMVDGQNDVAYTDVYSSLPRATEEGQQAQFVVPEIAEPEPEPEPEPEVTGEPKEPGGPKSRPAGKLYGRSLIDDLEARKASMRSKQRTFAGDNRPSMMSRNATQRSSTLIDPESLKQRPVSQNAPIALQRQLSGGADLSRRNSKTLLNFDNEIPGVAGTRSATLGVDQSMPRSRSVFGVDTIWEREMAKLKEMQATEQADEAKLREQEARQAAQEEVKRGKNKKKGKGKEQATLEVPAISVAPESEPAKSELVQHISASPPKLPQIERATARRPPPPTGDEEDESDDESDADDDDVRPAQEAGGWASSDEEGGDARRGTAPRQLGSTYGGRPGLPAGDDSDEDVPLAATMQRVVQRAAFPPAPASDHSSEDAPLSKLLEQKSNRSVLDIDFDKPARTASPNDDADDVPLGLRASRVAPAEAEDDDVPLAVKEQQRRTQFMAAAAQQQQQMMMQAQMTGMSMMGTGSMYFGAPPSMYGPQFFGPPPMASPFIMPTPPQLPSPPPLHDAAKLNRVDKWRREVQS